MHRNFVKKLPSYSYFRFLQENKKSTKEARQMAIKRFLDATRKIELKK